MATTAALAARIDPPRPGVSPSVWHPVWEMVSRVTAGRAVAVARVACTNASGQPAQGLVRLWNATKSTSASVSVWGSQDVTVALVDVDPGDLLIVALTPSQFGLTPVGRMWAADVAVTFTDRTVLSSPSTTAPPTPPTQTSASGNGQLSVVWSAGFAWGGTMTAVNFRWRPLGSEDWVVVWGATATSPTLLTGVPNDQLVEVQASSTSDTGGVGAWGPSRTWAATAGGAQTITLDTADGSAAYDPTASISGGAQTITLDTADGSGVFDPSVGFTAPATIFLDSADLSVPLLDESGQPVLDEFGAPIMTDSSGAFDPAVTLSGPAGNGFGLGFGITFGT